MAGVDRDHLEQRLAEHSEWYMQQLMQCRDGVEGRLVRHDDALAKVGDDVRAMREMLEAWNNMKGFAAGVRFIGATARILLPIGLLIGALIAFAKTGQWTWPSK